MPRSHRITASVALLAAATAALAGCAGGATTPSETSSSASPSYVTEGKLTVATGEPAYYPYVIDDKPESGEGFESAVIYAVADELGFDKSDVVWKSSTFDEGIAPGPKDWDLNIQQYSITDEREQNVDFSTPYYSTPQAVITIKGSKAEGVNSIAGFADLLVGAATGTTSFTAIEQTLQPTAGAQAFNSNDDAVLALKSGQIDALVVDLPTAFYLTGAELDNGVLLGQLPPADGVTDEWGIVLDKDSSLTASVSAAIDDLKSSGKLDDIISQWLGADAGAPVLQ